MSSFAGRSRPQCGAAWSCGWGASPVRWRKPSISGCWRRPGSRGSVWSRRGSTRSRRAGSWGRSCGPGSRGSAPAGPTVLLGPTWIRNPSSARRWPVRSTPVLPLSAAFLFVVPFVRLVAQQTGTVSGTVVATESGASLAPASGAPDSVATTVPDTVPVCCATNRTKGTTNRNAADRGRTRVDLTGHLLADDGLRIQVGPSNTVGPAGALPRLPGPHERPHDPALRDLVDPRRLHTDPLEPGLRQQPLILGFLQRTGDAPHPQLHAAPHCGRDLPANDDIRHGEPAARSENAEGLAQHLTLIDREVDHAVRDDHVH